MTNPLKKTSSLTIPKNILQSYSFTIQNQLARMQGKNMVY